MAARYRTVYRNFRYTECDDFAAYLEEMAKEGWILESWPGRLKFRREEPRALRYAVYVFPYASMYDTEPGQKTREFAEYCRAAGWELVDARRKFCIFRQIREDPPAVPIVTDKERFRNISQAETGACLYGLATYLVPLLVWYGSALRVLFPMFFLNAAFLGLLVYWAFLFVWYGIRLGKTLVWRQRTGQQIREGREVYFGTHRDHRRPGPLVCSAVFCVLIPVFLAVSGDMAAYLPAVTICAGAAFALACLISSRHPRGSGTAADAAESVVLFVALLAVILRLAAGGAGGQDLSAYPLLPSDYAGTTAADLLSEQLYRTQSILGRMTAAALSWRSGDRSGSVMYEITDSPLSVLCDAAWEHAKAEYFDGEESGYRLGLGKSASSQTGTVTDVTSLWHAERACMLESGQCRYLVQYPGRVILLTVSGALEEDEIGAVREKLSPGAER